MSFSAKRTIVAMMTATALAVSPVAVPQAAAIDVVTQVDSNKIQDTMFVIDTTESMADDIASAKRQAIRLAAEILDQHPQSRVGLVQYRDYASAWEKNGRLYAAITEQNLTRDRKAFSQAVNRLNVYAGADNPEDMLSGIMEAFGQDWNPAATPNIIVIGDAPAHDPECATGFTMDDVIRVAQGLNAGVTFHPYDGASLTASTRCGGLRLSDSERPIFKDIKGTGNATGISVLSRDSSLTSQADKLTGLTGGVTVNYENLDTVLVDTQKLLAKRPVVNFDAPSTASAGWSVEFKSFENKVYNPGNVSIVIDFGDGSPAVTMNDGSTYHRYDAPGKYTATITVTDGAGASASVSRIVTVTEDNNISNSTEAGSTAVKPWEDREASMAASSDLSAQTSSIIPSQKGKTTQTDPGVAARAIAGVVVLILVIAAAIKDLPGLPPLVRDSANWLAAFTR